MSDARPVDADDLCDGACRLRAAPPAERLDAEQLVRSITNELVHRCAGVDRAELTAIAEAGVERYQHSRIPNYTAILARRWAIAEAGCRAGDEYLKSAPETADASPWVSKRSSATT